jgi:hypothetical protein
LHVRIKPKNRDFIVNPSAANWIPKYVSLLQAQNFEVNLPGDEAFYDNLLESGFIYGVSIRPLPSHPVSSLKLTREELTKINLFHALLHTHLDHAKKIDYNGAINHMLGYYNQLDKGKQGLLRWLNLSNGNSQRLEKVLSARIQESSSFLGREITGVLAYALIYVDVIAYGQALETGKDPSQFAGEIERMVITCCYLALSSKRKKNKYDRLLIELFESSAEYLELKIGKKPIALDDLKIPGSVKESSRRYLLDLSCIAVWDDHAMDEDEYGFLLELATTLNLTKQQLENSLEKLAFFMSSNQTSIKLFETANPVKHFYNQSTATVKLLILRNRKRLQQELNESGDLLRLLSQSTRRELSPEEKTQVRQQLLDICKTIPSLTIFLLPGGTVLLPILAKFIPRLLPSSFQENRLDNNN